MQLKFQSDENFSLKVNFEMETGKFLLELKHAHIDKPGIKSGPILLYQCGRMLQNIL